ncbi:MAG TPA: hypothetical protein VFJ16_08295 [Longimicrobium sp.]|nr:hypothetical protein [Longimicrobium sp.]
MERTVVRVVASCCIGVWVLSAVLLPSAVRAETYEGCIVGAALAGFLLDLFGVAWIIQVTDGGEGDT